jgi:hypothetical protein
VASPEPRVFDDPKDTHRAHPPCYHLHLLGEPARKDQAWRQYCLHTESACTIRHEETQDTDHRVEDEFVAIFRRTILERGDVAAWTLLGDAIASFDRSNNLFGCRPSGVPGIIARVEFFKPDRLLGSALGDELLQYSCPHLQYGVSTVVFVGEREESEANPSLIPPAAEGSEDAVVVQTSEEAVLKQGVDPVADAGMYDALDEGVVQRFAFVRGEALEGRVDGFERSVEISRRQLTVLHLAQCPPHLVDGVLANGAKGVRLHHMQAHHRTVVVLEL